MTDPQLENDYTIKHLKQLVGKKVTGVCVDQDGEMYGLVFTGGVVAWIMCDPEGNGPGHLDIDNPAGGGR